MKKLVVYYRFIKELVKFQKFLPAFYVVLTKVVFVQIVKYSRIDSS